MPYRPTNQIEAFCVCCYYQIVIGLCKSIKKKVIFSNCCGGPVCGGGFCTRICQFCKRSAAPIQIERKTSFPRHPLHLSWEEWVRCTAQYSDLSHRPRFREFVESYQFPLQWHDHLRLRELFHEYIFLRPASLQLASVFRMRMCMCMHIRLSNASVFGQECHKITQMLALCRANGVRVIHPKKIHAHFGIAFLCVTRISMELDRRRSEDGSVSVCSKTYWRTMIPWIIRWITRLPK